MRTLLQSLIRNENLIFFDFSYHEEYFYFFFIIIKMSLYAPIKYCARLAGLSHLISENEIDKYYYNPYTNELYKK